MVKQIHFAANFDKVPAGTLFFILEKKETKLYFSIIVFSIIICNAYGQSPKFVYYNIVT